MSEDSATGRVSVLLQPADVPVLLLVSAFVVWVPAGVVVLVITAVRRNRARRALGAAPVSAEASS